MTEKQITFQSAPTKGLQGKIRVPGDKSISHRSLLLSAIAQGNSRIEGLLMGEDNLATMAALESMGVEIKKIGETDFEVQGVGLHGLKAPSKKLDLGNSGTGMRLLVGLLAGQDFDSEIVGDASLMKRPMKRIVDPLTQMGAKIEMSSKGTPPLKISGGQPLKGIDYVMPMASAQVKSCLLLAGLYAEGETRITEPAPTRDHTERMLKVFGYPGMLKGTTIQVPADISSAAFFMVAASIIPDSNIVLKDVGVNPTRIGVITILKAMGANIVLENERTMSGEPVADIQIQSATLKGIEIPIKHVPLAIDELPVIMIAAACADGKTILKGAEELRVKETDRIAAVAEGLTKLGIEVETQKDGMIVQGGKFVGGEVNSFGDHRMAMAFAVAGTVATDSVMIRDCANVETSFPGFVEMANQLGMKVEKQG